MKLIKILSLFILTAFLINLASAMTVTGGWQGDAQSVTINNGQNVSFSALFLSNYPPMNLKIQLYSQGKLIYTFLNTQISTSTYSYANTITPSIYNQSGTYNLVITGTDQKNTNSWNLILNVNSIITPPSPDTTISVVTLNSPTNNYSTNSSTITFNGIASDNVAISNVSIFTNISGSWITNQTNTLGANNTNYLFTITGIPDGTYIWNYKACDTSGNCAFGSSNRTFMINTTTPQNQTNQSNYTLPSIQFVYPTPGNGYSLQQNYIPVNVSITSSLSTNTYLYLYGPNYFFSNITSNFYNFTGLQAGTYYLNATVIDSSGNASSTGTISVNLQPQQSSVNSGYTYQDVYTGQYIQQISRTNKGISLQEQQPVSSIGNTSWIILLIETLFILVIVIMMLVAIARIRLSRERESLKSIKKLID